MHSWPRWYAVVQGPLLLHSSSAAGGQVVCDAPNGQILKVSALDGAWMECELGDSETGHEELVPVPVYLHCSSWKSIARLSDGAYAEKTWREQSRSGLPSPLRQSIYQRAPNFVVLSTVVEIFYQRRTLEVGTLVVRRARDFGVRGAGAFRIRCGKFGKLARSRESNWLSLVKILMLSARA